MVYFSCQDINIIIKILDWKFFQFQKSSTLILWLSNKNFNLKQCGVDINQQNALNQTAADVVIKQKVENEIKCLIRAFSQATHAISVQPYLNNHAGSLNFDRNELIVVLERPSSTQLLKGNSTNEIYSSLNNNIYGSMTATKWRGFILDPLSYTTRSGYFPSNCVKLIEPQCDDPRPTQVALATPESSDICDYNSIYAHGTNSGSKSVTELLRAGMNDSQIIFDWLGELNMQQYYQNFVQAGYDLLTIFKTTPADLSAIGIHDPLHRQLIHRETQLMNKLNIVDLEEKFVALLANINSIEELLKLIHLEQYFQTINQQHVYKGLEHFANTLTWEDLEEIGVHKLGHQKKLMLVAKRLKEIKVNRVEKQRAASQSEEDTRADRPVPPMRVNSIKAAKPFLPPRKSSHVEVVSTYATLPKNRNQARNNLHISAHCFQSKESDSASSSPSSSQASTSSSGAISPSSMSSSANSASYLNFDSQDNSKYNSFQQPPRAQLNSNYYTCKLNRLGQQTRTALK